MNKRLAAVFAAMIVLALAAPSAFAEDRDKVTAFGVDVGYFAPFESGVSGGFTGRLTYDMHYWDPVGVRVAAGLAMLDADVPGGDVSVDLYYLSGGVIYTFDAGSVYPYATFGLGLYNFSVSGAGSDTEFGVNFGGGVEMPLAENIYFAPELTFHVISGDGPDTAMAFTLGIRFHLP